MEPKYLCPSCRNCINVDKDIILVGKTKTGLNGLVILHAELGNYITRFSADFTIVEGNVVKFSCPICQQALSSNKIKNKAQIVYIDSDEKEAGIVFSEIFGEQCTYKVINNEVSESFGSPEKPPTND